MKAKYAKAIRAGIKLGLEVKYGSSDDPYYANWDKARWSYMYEAKLCNLVRDAFERTSNRVIEKQQAGMTQAQLRRADKQHSLNWEIHTESRVERQIRLLHEEVAVIRRRIDA